MPLTLPCPKCHAPLGLAEPYPAPASAVRCPACDQLVRVTYPHKLLDMLAERGHRVASGSEEHGPITSRSAPSAPPVPGPNDDPMAFGAPRPVLRDREPDDYSGPVAAIPVAPAHGPAASPPVATPPPVAKPPSSPAAPPPSSSGGGPPAPPPNAPPAWRRPLRAALLLGTLGLLIGAGASAWIISGYTKDLPSVDTLRAYRPATVTTVHAHDGTLLGEIYEERRYVLEIDEIPQVVKDAFVAAEDAAFWDHGGIDYMGIARAMGRNIRAGRISQGGSTITQQVAKNFLLTSDRKLARKVKEAALAWRIEDAYTKDHILYLYLNEIFLGSQAYGVEAAARTFFGKHVDELSLAEVAIIAGLPPRPSAWNPHADFSAAKNRQAYVLDQMVKKGFVTQAQADEAAAATIKIVPRGNTFREVAPHFTEYARRYLVERYGAEKVLEDGMRVVTTCDLTLQDAARKALVDGVYDVDQRIGLRRDAIEHLDGDQAIAARIEEIEQQMLDRWMRHEDPTGRIERPSISPLAPGDIVHGVVTEVSSKWVRVSVGHHEGLIPLAWADWAYPPNPERSWRYRTQDDLTRLYDFDDDGTDDGAMLQRGDVISVKVASMSSTDEDLAKTFRNTPGADTSLVALRLWQEPEVEGAIFSFDLSDDPAKSGAVRAMVGGADFARSQLNRVVQSRRQVGSTFKPIVYAAALETRKLTTASIVPDAPLAFGSGEEIWKPGNYGNDFKGNITLRQALALSRNTSTVRVLDSVDPGMTRGVIYDFARRLGLGGTPKHLAGDDWVASPSTDQLCAWVDEEDGERCVDAFASDDGTTKCRACDLSMGLGSASISMEELARAYGILANGGHYVEPFYILSVTDRDGELLEEHVATEPVQVVPEAVASLATWLMEAVATSGTAAAARRELRVPVAGKTGTTNDEKDAWFVGFTPDVVTAVWVGYDQPRPLGVSSTGGRTALPIWIEYMRTAIEGRDSGAFPMLGGIEWARIDEATGRRVSGGGRDYPFLSGTVPESTGYSAGEASLQDLATEL